MRYEDKLKWLEDHPPPCIHVHMDPAVRKEWVKGYRKDPAFKDKGKDTDESTWYHGTRFYKDKNGLLYFRDADFQARLCVPRNQRNALLSQIHDSPAELAHAG
ncbi:hypothetical protein EXIGLDRAFT_633219, partial [Exidia glandulosa HHB12029]